MTLNEVCKSIIKLAVDNKINGERFTVKRLYNQMSAMFRGKTKIKNKVVIQIKLPDGEWFMTVNRYSNAKDGYDFTIPDTREQEDKIYRALIS